MKPQVISIIIAMTFVFGEASQAQTYDTNNVVVQTFAGYGIPGYVDGQGQFTAFFNPSQIVSDTASNLYVWDSSNYRIRKITPEGTVSTLAGGGGNNLLLGGAGNDVIATDLDIYPTGLIRFDWKFLPDPDPFVIRTGFNGVGSNRLLKNLYPGQVEVGDSTVYAGGLFNNIGGQPRNKIAALNSTTGLAGGKPPPWGSSSISASWR